MNQIQKKIKYLLFYKYFNFLLAFVHSLGSLEIIEASL
jgi:hypothetical protein